jgi:hypothetical protein
MPTMPRISSRSFVGKALVFWGELISNILSAMILVRWGSWGQRLLGSECVRNGSWTVSWDDPWPPLAF